jgi:hypothetical protein
VAHFRTDCSGRSQARGALGVAQRHLNQKSGEVLNVLERCEDEAEAFLERWAAALREFKQDCNEIRAVERKYEQDWIRYCDLSDAWRATKYSAHMSGTYWAAPIPWVVTADDLPGELILSWPMVAGSGIGPPPLLVKSIPPELPPWRFPTWPPWVKTCKRRGIDPQTSPWDEVFDNIDV